MALLLDIHQDDVFITSFPKSGNTWLRFFLANLLRVDGDVHFRNLDRIVPDPYKVDPETLLSLPRPRLLKSHEPVTGEYPRVVYLVRDVRAIVTSHYRQRLRMGRIPHGLPMKQFTDMFVAGQTSPYGGWDDHVRGWVSRRQREPTSLLVVRYEDMLDRGPSEFRKICDFVHLGATDEEIEIAYGRSSFHRMRRLEEEAGRGWIEKARAKDLSIPFMYSGQSDSWRTDLDNESEELLWSRYGALLSELHYER